MKTTITIFIFMLLASFSFAQAQSSNIDSLITMYCVKEKISPTMTSTGLRYIIIKPGKGEKAKDNQTATINYTGKLLDGKIFDNNTSKKYGHKKPFDFTVGAGHVIKGFEEGVKLLGKGGKALLIIPPSLGYGDKDLTVIPPNSVLVFTIELKDIN